MVDGVATASRRGLRSGLAALRSDSEGPADPVDRILRLAALEHEDLWVVTVYAVAIGVVSLGVPVAAQALVNTVAFTASPQQVFVLASLLAVGLVIGVIL